MTEKGHAGAPGVDGSISFLDLCSVNIGIYLLIRFKLYIHCFCT